MPMIGFLAPVSSDSQLSAMVCFPSRNDPMLLKQPQYADGLKVSCGGTKLLGSTLHPSADDEILRLRAQTAPLHVTVLSTPT